jgi:aspartyl-tRNA(Asn)/glutamyl-tRNA(Gln) amidotransferase subunit C
MTEFSPDLVRKIAHLARLKVTDAEGERLSRELGEILSYVELLDEVNTEGVEPMAHAIELINVLREDIPQPSLPREQALANAPGTDGRYFLVPAILDEV